MDQLDQIKKQFLRKTIRHVVTDDLFLVRDVITTDKGIMLVIQSLKDEGPQARHRIFKASVEIAQKNYSVES